MIFNAVLKNPQHEESGEAAVPFPIPPNEYEPILEQLEALELGDAVRQDCRISKMDSACPILKRLAGGRVNLDELDYLAKRLNSFTDQEAAQFQAAAVKFGSSGIKDLINLTFCCQQTTVVTDFSDLEQIGWNYYLTLHGGRAPTKELERLDARHFALELICNTDGYVKNFLAETLKLELSEKKTKVTHSSDFARFLSYGICISRNNSIKYNEQGVAKREFSGRVMLYVPKEKWMRKLLEYHT